MEIKKRGNKISFNHLLKKNELYKIMQNKNYFSLSIYPRPQIVKGYSGDCGNGQSILLIDYDNTLLDIVLEDYFFIQKKFKLPQAYLFSTKENNYHVVCPLKLPSGKIPKILMWVRCDANYRTMPLRSLYKSYILRISDKEGSKKSRFLRIIGQNHNNKKVCSNAHKLLFERVFKQIKHPSVKWDDSKTIKLQEYETFR